MSASSNPSAKRKINVQKTMDVAKKRNKRDAALRFDLFSTGLLKISAAKDMNRLEMLSAFKNHADNPQLDQVNRIQNLLILQKQYVDEKNVAVAEDEEKLISSSSLSRTTCFIPFSHHYPKTVSYTHLRAHETRHDLVCRLL